jgi:hypothetical protein
VKQVMKVRVRRMDGQVGGEIGPPPPPPISAQDIERLQFEREAANAEAARIKRELDEIKKAQPSDEQRARWAELEAQAQRAEEERLAKSGEFEAWRKSIQDNHARELNEVVSQRENEAQRARQVEEELRDTLIGRHFADALDLFGPAGRTVLLPEVAQSYFGKHVEVEAERGIDGKAHRRVVVKDSTGTIIVDPKTGRPETFSKAMSIVIDAHPHRGALLRGSGKVGAGSPGGGEGGEHGIDLTRLKSRDFQDPKVREAVKRKMNTSGGLQTGPGFDQLNRQRTERS